MNIAGYELFAILGFLFAAYSVIANDSIQTLGTFLSSNNDKHWTLLWAYASAIIIAVMIYGYYGNNGDIAFSRLNTLPYPEGPVPEAGIKWWHALPPLVLLVLTRFAIPVSTTFLVLTIFALTGSAATDGVLSKMLVKSALGYVVAFGAAAVIYVAISRVWERWIHNTRGAPMPQVWIALQWASTAFLWSQWLMQDLANIFIFLPRETATLAGETQVTFSPTMLVFATAVIVLIQGYTFATRGGAIQKIVLRKTNTTDIRAATVVDFIYGLVLLFFKELNDIPMSTTWVFLGLLAGREMAIAIVGNLRDNRAAFADVASDAGRAAFGLVISVLLAFGMPWLATGTMPKF